MINESNSCKDIISIVNKGITNMANTINNIVHGMMQIVEAFCVQFEPYLKELEHVCRGMIFMEIADEIGYPIYMEIDTELEDKIICSYIRNNNQCNKREMQMIIWDYYKDEYIECILSSIKNVQVFNPDRVTLIEEGIRAYQLGLYGSSASLFAAQLSGMINDVYKEMNTFHRFSKKEKQEIINEFNQRCQPDSEKGILMQIICCQPYAFVWVKVLQHFLTITYSSNENMENHPQRHMICHGKQTNYNTKEMNLKLILCIDIILELAWRIRKMKEETLIIDADAL